MGLKYNPFSGKLDFIGSGGAGICGTVGSNNNSVLRADVGSGCIQNSGVVIEDTIISYNCTGDAAADTITAPGSNFENGERIRFDTLTGGSGINTSNLYYVVNANGSTFQVSTLDGGAPTLFSSNITVGELHNGWDPAVVISQNTPETNSDFIITPKGDGAFILGPEPDNGQTGGGSRGQYAVDLQVRRNASTQVASGRESFLVGNSNTASGIYSVALGSGNISSEIASVALGGLNQATGRGSFAAGGSTTGGVGGNTASGFYSSCPGGVGALADRLAQQSHSSGFFSAIGDSQRTRFVLRNKTITNSAVELFLSVSGSSRLTIPSGKILAFTINISGVKSDGTAVAHYLRQYCLKNVAGTTSEVYAPVTIGSDNAAGTSIALSANDTNDALKVEVTGLLEQTWRWVAAVDAVEIAYGT